MAIQTKGERRFSDSQLTCGESAQAVETAPARTRRNHQKRFTSKAFPARSPSRPHRTQKPPISGKPPGIFPSSRRFFEAVSNRNQPQNGPPPSNVPRGTKNHLSRQSPRNVPRGTPSADSSSLDSLPTALHVKQKTRPPPVPAGMFHVERPPLIPATSTPCPQCST